MIIGMPTTSYPAHEGDASGAFVRTLAVALARRGHRVEVLAPSVRGEQIVHDPGVRVTRVRYAPRALERTFGGHGAPDNLRTDPTSWPGAVAFPLALARAIRAHRSSWDAIVSHWLAPTAMVAGRLADGRPHLAIVHGTDADLVARVPGLRDRALRSADTIAFVSSALASRLAVEGAFVQPMGIDRDETLSIDRDAARRRMNLDGFIALALARLVPIKGLDRAIEAARIANVALVIAGEGPERATLERRAAGANVRFVGHVSGEDRLALLRGCDAFLAPSRALGARTEGTPTAVLEALAASLPIVGTRIAGIADVVPPDAGLLSDGSADALARDLSRLVHDAPLRTSLALGARRASIPFDADRVAARFERVLQGSTRIASAGKGGASALSATRDG
jgi:glycosyltransferase involved in cell wall biosynthesis